jgi:hypothetical protein
VVVRLPLLIVLLVGLVNLQVKGVLILNKVVRLLVPLVVLLPVHASLPLVVVL